MIVLKFRYAFLCVLAAALFVVGCDSSDDDEDNVDMPASELFVGDWGVTSAADLEGTRDQTSVIVDQGSLNIAFDDAEMFVLTFDFTDESEEDLVAEGPYTVSESSTTVSLQVSLNGLSLSLPFTYRFIDNDTVELTTTDASIAATIGLLLGATLEGNAVLVMGRVG